MSVTYTGLRKKGRNERFEAMCFSTLNKLYSRFQHIAYYPDLNVDKTTANKFLTAFHKECPPDIQANFRVGYLRGIPYVKINIQALSSLQTLFVLTIARMLDEDPLGTRAAIADKTKDRSFWQKLVLNIDESGIHSIMTNDTLYNIADDKEFITKIEPLSVIFAKMKGVRWDNLVREKSLHGQFAFNWRK